MTLKIQNITEQKGIEVKWMAATQVKYKEEDCEFHHCSQPSEYMKNPTSVFSKRICLEFTLSR
jgi:hypothetical protein